MSNWGHYWLFLQVLFQIISRYIWLKGIKEFRKLNIDYGFIATGYYRPRGAHIVAVGTDQVWSWVPTYIGLGFIGFGYGCAGDVSMSYLMDSYPNAVIETMTVVAVINNCIGCVFTFACSPFINALGNTKTFIILAVIEFVIMASACFSYITARELEFGQKTGTWNFVKQEMVFD